MSDEILVYIDGREPFDPDDVYEILRELPGIQNLRRCWGPRPDSLSIEADFKYRNDVRHVSLIPSHKTITVADCGETGLALAVEIGKRFLERKGRVLRTSDTQYTFYQVLDVPDLKSLQDRIREHPHAAAVLQRPGV